MGANSDGTASATPQDLLPCLHCEDESPRPVTRTPLHSEPDHFMMCRSCRARGPQVFETEGGLVGAFEAWNKRSTGQYQASTSQTIIAYLEAKRADAEASYAVNRTAGMGSPSHGDMWLHGKISALGEAVYFVRQIQDSEAADETRSQSDEIMGRDG